MKKKFKLLAICIIILLLFFSFYFLKKYKSHKNIDDIEWYVMVINICIIQGAFFSIFSKYGSKVVEACWKFFIEDIEKKSVKISKVLGITLFLIGIFAAINFILNIKNLL